MVYIVRALCKSRGLFVHLSLTRWSLINSAIIVLLLVIAILEALLGHNRRLLSRFRRTWRVLLFNCAANIRSVLLCLCLDSRTCCIHCRLRQWWLFFHCFMFFSLLYRCLDYRLVWWFLYLSFNKRCLIGFGFEYIVLLRRLGRKFLWIPDCLVSLIMDCTRLALFLLNLVDSLWGKWLYSG